MQHVHLEENILLLSSKDNEINYYIFFSKKNKELLSIEQYIEFPGYKLVGISIIKVEKKGQIAFFY